MKAQKPKIVKLKAEELEGILRRGESRNFSEQDYKVVLTIVQAYIHVITLLEKSKVSIKRLKSMIFGSSTEKISSVVGGKTSDSSTSQDDPAESSSDKPDDTDSDDKPNSSDKSSSSSKPPFKGHGRKGADSYTGANQVEVPHSSLQAGDPCPDCGEGSTLYEMSHPGVFVQIVGQAPLGSTVYSLQKLRCDLCGKIFTSDLPEGVGLNKYDESAAAMISVLKYGTGLPFNRLEGLQEDLEIPLPSSTQWDIVHDTFEKVVPVFESLVWHAAQGDLVHNDDTMIKILELMGKRAEKATLSGKNLDEESIGKDRTGMFTTGIVSMTEGHRIGLFFSGRRHAGENLKEVLLKRSEELDPPIRLSDALSRNLPGELKTIVANCLAHGRRRFVDVHDIFPEECQHVLEALKIVYQNDAVAREQGLSPEQRLYLHQTIDRSVANEPPPQSIYETGGHELRRWQGCINYAAVNKSEPVMNKLRACLKLQFDDRLVEPNSALGESISYMLKHWKELTLFLRKAGAPLDNNIVERALKKSILHRKNSLFFRSRRGA
jgi:transposase